MDTEVFWNSLPKKAVGTGCLLFDRQGSLLIVKPTYKPTWQLPGGVVEAGESPRQACAREVFEELGLRCTIQRLVCIDYVSPNSQRHESIQFIFLGDTLSAQHIASIRLPPEELSEWRFLPVVDALLLFDEHLGRRVMHCHAALVTERTLYLENQEAIQ